MTTDTRENITTTLNNSLEEYKVGSITFYIKKLSAFDQNAVFEEIRYHLATETDLFDSFFGNDENISVEEAQKQGTKMFTAILKLDPKFIRFLCDMLFKGVTFTTDEMAGLQPLPLTTQNEETAFRNISFTTRYELLVRCLKLNFSDSLESIVSALTSLWGGAAEEENTPQSQPGVSQPSFRG